jgi:hypothetical protein
VSEQEKRTQGPQTYVVQMQFHGGTSEDGVDNIAWHDIATVEVPPRTPRKVAIKKALTEAGIEPDGEKLKVRALDADSAEVHEPEPHQPPAEWRFG